MKNIGKKGSTEFLSILRKIAETDPDSMVRREAVSSIGRMRDISTVPLLKEFLHNNDPKIVLQAIRGLLVFRKNKDVVEAILEISDHPNEIIQSFIKQEFSSIKAKPAVIPHPKSYDYLKNTCVLGDVRDILSVIPDDSIHLTFTSPPYYNASDYSIYEIYEDYLDLLDDVFIEVHRVTKRVGFLYLILHQ